MSLDIEYENEYGAWLNITLVIGKPEFPECADELGMLSCSVRLGLFKSE